MTKTRKQITDDQKEKCCVSCGNKVSKGFWKKHENMCASCHEEYEKNKPKGTFCMDCGKKISKKKFKENDGLCDECSENCDEAPAGWEAEIYGEEIWGDY